MCPVLPKNVHVIMLQKQIVQLPIEVRYEDVCDKWLLTGGLKNKSKKILQTVISKSGCGHLREVVPYKRLVIRLGKFGYFGREVTQERWSLTGGGCKGRFDCTSNGNRWL